MSMGITCLEVQEQLRMLKLTQAEASLDRLAEEASQGEWGYIEFLGRLLREEIAARKERRLGFKLRLAHFPWGKTLDQFDSLSSLIWMKRESGN